MAKKDNIYKVGNFNDLPFSFNEEVAEVFEDMVDRSVPGYRSSLKLIENLGKKYFQNKSFCYDLGCSLGASTLSLVEAMKEREGQICAVDNSKAMISTCNKKFKHLIDSKKVNFINQDIESTEIKDASIKMAVDSVKKIITTSVDKSKLDNLFNKNLEETKIALKKINL